MRPKVLLAGSAALAAALVLALLVARRDPVDTSGSAPNAGAASPADTAPDEPDARPRGGATGSSALETPPERTASASAEPASVPPARGSPFTGRVVDVRGEPIPDASVYLAATERSTGIPLEHLAPERAAWAGRVETRTDAAGRFEVAPESAGSLRLAVRARGFAPHERVLATSDASHALGDITLAPSVVLAGRVVDSARKPVAGAALRRLTPDAKPEALFSSSGGDLAATTGADGTFEIDELASGPWLLLIHADARPDQLERGETTEPGQRVTGLEFVLADGAELRGRVVGAPQGVLARAWISAVPRAGNSAGKLYAGEHVDADRFVVLPRGARCAEDGSFVIAGLSRDVAYRVSARASGDFFAPALTGWVDADAGDTHVELVYAPARALVFQVVDAVTSQPVTDFEVRAGAAFQTPLAGEGGRARTNFADGRVRFENVFAASGEEPITVVIEARGYARREIAGLSPVDGADVDLGVVRLERAPVITLHIVDDATDRPVAGAEVTLLDEAALTEARPATQPQPAVPRATSDRDGVARLNSSPGRNALLFVRHADFALFRSELLSLPETGDVTERVRLHAGGTVVVEVRDVLGAQVRGVRIQHTNERGELAVPAANSPDGARTNASGTLRFTHLAPGEHTFQADEARATVRIADGREETVRLVVRARSRLTGRVTEGGQPLSAAILSFVLQGEGASAHEVLTARTNGNGDFGVASLAIGTYRVAITHPARAFPFEVEIYVGEAQSRYTVDLPSAAITGRVVDETGRGVAGVCVRLERVQLEAVDDVALLASSGATNTPCVFSGADGSFTLRGVQSDIAVVAALAAPNYQRAESPVLRVGPSEIRANVDLVARPGAVLDVRLVFAPGRAASACRIRATAEDGARESVVLASGAGGTVRFSSLRPGSWRVRVEHCADGSATTALEQVAVVAAGATNAVTFEVR